MVITLLIAALFNYGLYNQALFNGGLPNFDGPILLMIILTLILGLAFSVQFIRLKEKPAIWPLLLIALVPLSVIASSIGAVSGHGAYMSILIHVVYALLFVFGYVFVRSEKCRHYAALVLLLSGFGVVLLGFVNWFGLNIYKDAVNMFSGEYRLMSVFQYANTYGAFLIALFLASLFMVTYSGSRMLRFISAAMLPLILISLILTLSRGAWLAFPAAFVLILLFLRPSRQILNLLYAAAAGIPALAVFSLVNRLGIEQQTSFSIGRFLLGLALLLIASAFSAVIGHLISRYVEPKLERWASWDAKRASSLWFPLGTVAAIFLLGPLFLKTSLIALLPDNIEQRVSSINFAQHSVLERFSFYSDALKISRDYPVFGAGGGAWNVLYDQYQSYPYLSTQVHSFILQYLVEFGWFGLLIVLAVFALILIGYAIRLFRRGMDETSFIFFIFAVSLLVHSLIDFDMSYVVVGAIIFFSLGVLVQQLPDWQWKRENTLAKIYACTLPVLILPALFFSIQAFNGYLSYEKTVKLLEGSRPQASQLLDTSGEAMQKGKNIVYYQLHFQILQQLYAQTGDPAYLSESRQTVEHMQKNEPRHRETWGSLYALYLSEGNHEEAIRHLLQGAEQYPWDLSIYSEAFHQLYAFGSADQPAYWNDALLLFDNMKSKMAQIGKLPPYQVQTKPFEITKEIASIVACIQYAQQKTGDAYQTITQYINPDPGFESQDSESMRAFLGL
jgi:O-antigen ligase